MVTPNVGQYSLCLEALLHHARLNKNNIFSKFYECISMIKLTTVSNRVGLS